MENLDELQQYDPDSILSVHARSIFLGANNTKRAIIAKIEHIAGCGSSGCRIVILVPSTDKTDTFRIVFDTIADQIFMRSVVKSGDYSGLLALVGPRNVDGYGAWSWNKATNTYGFAGVLKFKQ